MGGFRENMSEERRRREKQKAGKWEVRAGREDNSG